MEKTKTIGFRPGHAMEQWLAEAAIQWGLPSLAEAAKRAAVLTLCGLDAEFFEPITELVRVRRWEANPDAFGLTAFEMRQAIDADNRARAARGKRPMTRAEILKKIEQAAKSTAADQVGKPGSLIPDYERVSARRYVIAKAPQR